MCPQKKKKKKKRIARIRIRREREREKKREKRERVSRGEKMRRDVRFGESKVVAGSIDFSVRSPITGAHSITARNPASEIHRYHPTIFSPLFFFTPTLGECRFFASVTFLLFLNTFDNLTVVNFS